MAEITRKEVEKTAKLAHLSFSDAEIDKFAEQFNQIVGFVEQISELNTENIEPTTHAVAKQNVLRKDEVHESMPLTDIEQNAPRFQDGSYVVPRIIEH